jgi:cytochrome P450
MGTRNSLNFRNGCNGGDPTAKNVSMKPSGIPSPPSACNIRTYRKFYQGFQENLEKGIGKDCFAKHFFEQADEFGFDADQKMFAAGSMIEAGSDTTRNQNNILMAHAAHDPSWIAKVRAQLDEVCGPNAERLPEYTDWEKLPWIHATIKETLRVFPNLVQLGAPHAVTYCPNVKGGLIGQEG